jgi:hypothetical protein
VQFFSESAARRRRLAGHCGARGSSLDHLVGANEDLCRSGDFSSYVDPTGEGVRHCAAGEIIEHSGPPSLVMEPVDQAARDILAEYEQQRGKKAGIPTARSAGPAGGL